MFRVLESRALQEAERPPMLESWYRTHLPHVEIDISSSGVRPYTFGELRRRVHLDHADLDGISVDDSTSLGGADLRKAVADRYADGDASSVMMTHGSSEAISLALNTLCAPGDRVVTTEPVYHSLRRVPEVRGCDLVGIPLTCFDENGDFTGDLEAVISEVTAMVVLNFPNNPTGRTISPATADAFARRSAEVGAFLVLDEAFTELSWRDDQTEARSTSPYGPGVIRFGTFSKAFGLPGLRVGWCIADPAVLSAFFALRDRTTLFLSPLVEAIATAAMRAADDLINPRREEAADNLLFLDRWIAEHADLVRWDRPTGGVCGMLRLRGKPETTSFCEGLLHETGVLLVPGEAFESPGAVRIGFGCSRWDLGRGLDRLSRHLDGSRT